MARNHNDDVISDFGSCELVCTYDPDKRVFVAGLVTPPVTETNDLFNHVAALMQQVLVAAPVETLPVFTSFDHRLDVPSATLVLADDCSEEDGKVRLEELFEELKAREERSFLETDGANAFDIMKEYLKEHGAKVARANKKTDRVNISATVRTPPRNPGEITSSMHPAEQRLAGWLRGHNCEPPMITEACTSLRLRHARGDGHSHSALRRLVIGSFENRNIHDDEIDTLVFELLDLLSAPPGPGNGEKPAGPSV